MRDIPFPEYLRVKTTVDDRSLNRRVMEIVRAHLPTTRPLHVLEVGAGIGTMLTRLLAWDFLPAEVAYTAVDAEPTHAQAAVEYWHSWAQEQGYSFETTAKGYCLSGPRHRVHITWHTEDVLAFATTAAPDYHLLLAHAFLDLVDLSAVLPALFRLTPGELFYFTLNFDGLTIFEPEAPTLDTHVLEHYHRTMDERRVEGRPAGESRTGRRLLTLLPAFGADILAVGSSDWVVYPRAGKYPPGEALFLHTILNFVEESLRERPDVDPQILQEWLYLRRGQVDAGKLAYVAHQLDFAGRVPGTVEERA